MDFIPAPGIILAEEIEEKQTGLKLELKSNENILYAKVLAVGPDENTQFGATIKGADYAKPGDTIYFLSYDQRNYDWVKIKGKKYFIVKFQDVRLISK